VVLLGAVVLVVSVFAVLMETKVLGDRLSVALDDLAQLAAAAVAGVACLLAARRAANGQRMGWVLLGAGMFAWSLGQLAWTVIEVGLQQTVPSPSIADVGYLGAIPLEVVAVLSFPLAPARFAARLRVLLDGLLIATSLLLVSYVFVIGPVIDAGSATQLQLAISLAYPVGDVAVAAVVILALSRVASGIRLPLMVMGAGLLALGVSDSFYAYAGASDAYQTGGVLDTGWVTGFLLVAAAAAVAPAAGEPPLDAEGRLQAVKPYVAVFAAILAAVWYITHNGAASLAIRWLTVTVFTILAVGLLIHRQDLIGMLRRSRSAEAALIENQAILNRILDAAPVAAFFLDQQGHAHVFGGRRFDRPGTEGGGDLERLLTNDPRAADAIARAMAGESSSVVIESAPDRLELFLDPVRSGDRVESVTGVAVDVSAEHRLLRVTAENEAKSRLLATVSHELRTPLSSVIGFADLMSLERSGTLNEVQRRQLDHIVSSGRHLLHIVNEILDFSRLAAGGVLSVSVDAVPVGPAIEEALARIGPIAGARRLSFVAPAEPLVVSADPHRLSQILLNLLSNAVRSTDVQGQVTVSCRRVPEGVEILVADDGVGIAESDLAGIFDEYVQAGLASHGGTGLGLPVSRRLAEAMGGRLTASSEPGKGSNFRLLLTAAAG